MGGSLPIKGYREYTMKRFMLWLAGPFIYRFIKLWADRIGGIW